MQFETSQNHKNKTSSQDTERWTSDAYRVRFGRIDMVNTDDDEPAGFRVSAWGLSENLFTLLDDYAESDIHNATEWLTAQQNSIVGGHLTANVLRNAARPFVYALTRSTLHRS